MGKKVWTLSFNISSSGLTLQRQCSQCRLTQQVLRKHGVQLLHQLATVIQEDYSHLNHSELHRRCPHRSLFRPQTAAEICLLTVYYLLSSNIDST